MITIKLCNYSHRSYLDYSNFITERIYFCKTFFGWDNERWRFEYIDFPKKSGGSHIPCILLRDEEDAIIFKLKFDL